jgi:hypothetical protein
MTVPTPDQYYSSLGRALARWGEVESKLGSLYCTCVDNVFPALYGYWGVVSAEAKIALVNATVSALLTRYPKLQPQWPPLYNRVAKKSKTRNRLAHGTVMFEPRLDKGYANVFFAPFGHKALALNTWNADADIMPTDRMYLSDIQRIIKSLVELGEDVSRFTSDLSEEIAANPTHKNYRTIAEEFWQSWGDVHFIGPDEDAAE